MTKMVFHYFSVWKICHENLVIVLDDSGKFSSDFVSEKIKCFASKIEKSWFTRKIEKSRIWSASQSVIFGPQKIT